MDTRASIDAILDKAYEARQRQDVAAAAACFTEDGCFRANGGPPTANRIEQTMSLKAQFEAFELLKMSVHCRIIDPPRAVVHWHGTFRASRVPGRRSLPPPGPARFSRPVTCGPVSRVEAGRAVLRSSGGRRPCHRRRRAGRAVRCPRIAYRRLCPGHLRSHRHTVGTLVTKIGPAV